MVTDEEPYRIRGTRWWKSLAAEHPPVDVKTNVPHSARMYDYFLDGKDSFPVDREAARQAEAANPNARIAARQNRAFMIRATRQVAREAGVHQFLDVGTGIPTSPNLHEVAQEVNPRARVVYVDNDPIVLTHARALLTSGPRGRTAFLEADLHQPESILDSPVVRGTLDLTRPVALSLIAILHFFPESDDPYTIVRRLVDGLPSGSHLTLTHGTADFDPANERAAAAYRACGIPVRLRSRAEFERLFAGLEFVAPGVQVAHRWRPDATMPDLTDAQVSSYGAIAVKK